MHYDPGDVIMCYCTCMCMHVSGINAVSGFKLQEEEECCLYYIQEHEVAASSAQSCLIGGVRGSLWVSNHFDEFDKKF